MKITLTSDQQDSVSDNIKAAEFAQTRLDAANAAVTVRTTEQAACFSNTKKLLDGLGLTSPDGPFTEVHQGRYSDGSIEPKLYVDEALPDPLPTKP